MNYIETCTKIAVFLWRSSNYRPLTSVLHVRPGWIIYQNMRETWEKKVMKFEREIPIGLDARRKKWQGGAIKAPPPPPMGLGLSQGPRLVIINAMDVLQVMQVSFVRRTSWPPGMVRRVLPYWWRIVPSWKQNVSHNTDPYVHLGQSLYRECVTRFVNRTVIPVCAKWRASWIGHFHEMVRHNFDANMRKCF